MLDVTRFPKMPHDQLRGLEHVSVPLYEFIHAHSQVTAGLHATIGAVNSWWIQHFTGATWEVHGLESIRSLTAPRGLVLVSNHRSFFDMYVISTVVNKRTDLLRRVAYPVRSRFFYDHPAGALLNLAVSGGAMWPPVFRDERRRLLNPIGWQQVVHTMTPGTGIGIHPEGTRGKGADPYEFLPLKPGLGQLVEALHPDTWVLPTFIAGLSNDLSVEVRRARQPLGQRGEPVRIRFAPPVRVGAVQALRLDAAETTAHIMAMVRTQAEVDRQERLANPSVL